MDEGVLLGREGGGVHELEVRPLRELRQLEVVLEPLLQNLAPRIPHRAFVVMPHIRFPPSTSPSLEFAPCVQLSWGGGPSVLPIVDLPPPSRGRGRCRN